MMIGNETETELSRSEVVAIIVAELEKKGPLPEGAELESFDFMASGQIDSLALLEFITELENKCELIFQDEDFNRAGFSTVGGLADIILDLRSK